MSWFFLCYCVFGSSANGFCNLGQIIFVSALDCTSLCVLFSQAVTVLEAPLNIDIAPVRE